MVVYAAAADSTIRKLATEDTKNSNWQFVSGQAKICLRATSQIAATAGCLILRSTEMA